MPSQGPLYPGSGTGSSAVAPEDANNWTGTLATVLSSEDGTEAQITAATYDSPDISYRILTQNHGFSIPADATIDGVVVEIKRRCFAGSAVDYRVQLLKPGGLMGDNKADTVNAWPGTLTTKSYGGVADTWNAGADLTPANINDVNFGVALSVQATSANTDIGVDLVRVTVYYTEAVANPPPRRATQTQILAH